VALARFSAVLTLSVPPFPPSFRGCGRYEGDETGENDGQKAKIERMVGEGKVPQSPEDVRFSRGIWKEPKYEDQLSPLKDNGDNIGGPGENTERSRTEPDP